MHHTESTDTRPEQHTFHFTGDGFEYFKIAVVNLALTLLTLGLYSPWAKVRTRQYFFGNTLLDNAAFHYTAKPLTILKGRLIALALLALYFSVEHFAPLALAPVAIGLALIAPWLIMRSIAFNLVNTVHRGLRFHLESDLATAYRIYLPPALFIAVMVSVSSLITPEFSDNIRLIAAASIVATVLYFALYPWFMKRAVQYSVDHAHYGDAAFLYGAGTGRFYKYYGANFLVLVGCYALLMGAFYLIISAGVSPDDAQALAAASPGWVSIAGAALTLVSIASTAFIAAWIKARSLNLHYDNISAPGHFRVQSHVKPSALGVIYLKNTALLILTLGIAYPWNKVRTARYVAACIHVATSVSLDNFAATATRQLDATGDEISEVFDLGIGL